ncbi:hypothetical protein ELI_1813 [Eubacterium callanderi]|uniref:Uncharacterized protein n=1 Tax=Eubacterium callanderi TaxID=53442 RepID=E3GK44_9FIRM|nr:hypothetical protein ELI_1813 [Eubacterium callanderi]
MRTERRAILCMVLPNPDGGYLYPGAALLWKPGLPMRMPGQVVKTLLKRFNHLI